MSLRNPRKRRTDRNELLRGVQGAIVPEPFKVRKGKKFADPEDILQNETNELLARAGQFHFRLSAHVLSKAHDASIGGWPDNPLISKLVPGLSILGPLELKRPGEDLRPNQQEMRANIGTVMADNLKDVDAYFNWFRSAHEHIQRLLVRHPLPPLPSDPPAQMRK